MILGPWSRRKTLRAFGNNGGETIKENDIETETAGCWVAGGTRDFISSSLTESQLDLDRDSGLSGKLLFKGEAHLLLLLNLNLE